MPDQAARPQLLSQPNVILNPYRFTGGGGAAYDFEETWTGGSADNSWTTLEGTPDYSSDRWNMAASTARRVQIDHGVPGGDQFAYFKINVAVSDNLEHILILGTSANDSYILGLLGSTDPHGFRVTGTGGASKNGATDKDLGTTYHVWIDYIQGASLEVFVSSSASSRGTAYLSDSAGILSDDLTRVKLGNASAVTDAWWLDRLIINSSAIGIDP